MSSGVNLAGISQICSGKLERKRGPVDQDAVDSINKVHRKAPDVDKLSLEDWEMLSEEYRRAHAKFHKGGR